MSDSAKSYQLAKISFPPLPLPLSIIARIYSRNCNFIRETR